MPSCQNTIIFVIAPPKKSHYTPQVQTPTGPQS